MGTIKVTMRATVTTRSLIGEDIVDTTSGKDVKEVLSIVGS